MGRGKSLQEQSTGFAMGSVKLVIWAFCSSLVSLLQSNLPRPPTPPPSLATLPPQTDVGTQPNHPFLPCSYICTTSFSLYHHHLQFHQLASCPRSPPLPPAAPQLTCPTPATTSSTQITEPASPSHRQHQPLTRAAALSPPITTTSPVLLCTSTITSPAGASICNFTATAPIGSNHSSTVLLSSLLSIHSLA
ncbi:hypothetical protein M0R45_008227 [Rubus argutus]|uniref:C2H2-type domain-containing protein n=1 Tax=Rubus argutus TaxID=59490 RepID=A0AAW1Y4B4_RUBAR